MEMSTDILLQTNEVSLKNLQSQKDNVSIKSHYSEAGKSFSEILASFKDEKNAETVKNTGNLQASDYSKETSSENYVSGDFKTEDEKKTEFDEVREDKNKSDYASAKIDEENSEDENNLYDLSLVNVEYNLSALSPEEKIPENTEVIPDEELKEISGILSEKIQSFDDINGAVVLQESDPLDFDPEMFEVTEVTQEELALESAQGLSVNNPADFLAKMETENNQEENSNINQVSEKKSKNSKITVTDLRSQKAENSVETAEDIKDAPIKVKTVFESSDSATITMDLRESAENANQNILSQNAQTAGSDGSNFQAMVQNSVFENAEEFVRAGNIILKDNDKGTINLILHPDDMGNVKIQLAMDGKSVTGHITVNTKEALEVFRNNAEALREAFVKNGFENAGFDVAYGGGNGTEFAGQQNDSSDADHRAFMAKRQYGALTSISDELDFDYEEDAINSNLGINIVA